MGNVVRPAGASVVTGILDAFRDAVVVVDERARIRYANDAATTLVDSEAGPLVGTDVARLVHPDDLSLALDGLRAELADTALPPFVLRVWGAGGEWVRVEVTGGHYEESGEVFAVVALRDLRARASADEEMRRQHELLWAILSSAQVGIVACDADGRLMAFSDVMRGYHRSMEKGVAFEQWLSRFEFFDTDGRAMSWHDAPIARALIREERVRNFEYLVRSDDGDLRHRQANGTPLYDGAGTKIGAVVSLHDLTEQRRAEEALRRQAQEDVLTGLANRAVFVQRLCDALDSHQTTTGELAVLFLDLDDFKTINDGLGHSVGDQLLREVASRLASRLRRTDTVARLGGDEFVVLCERLTSVHDVVLLAEKLREAVCMPVLVDDTELRTTASIGIALHTSPLDTAESLMRDADTAMYVAKDNGRNRWELFDEQVRQRVLRRLSASEALLRAVEAGQLRIHFQPIMDSTLQTMVGVEALARCVDGDGALMSPAEFIPLAEETGLIGRIDRWVLDQACRHAKAWDAAFPKQKLWVACNLSARTVSENGLETMVTSTLERYDLSPERLSIELTETALMSARPETREALRVLRYRGTPIGIDDFGTGYASLTYLRELPVSFIKIDRSFVADLGSEGVSIAIIDAVVKLAHALGLGVTAEGVETQAQAALLRTLGCDQMQGYLMSRPVGADEITQRLAGVVR